MSTTTTNYGFIKPELSDDIKLQTIPNLATDMDSIDTEIKDTNDRIDNLIINSGTSDAETIDARTNGVNSEVYSTLKNRLDADYQRIIDVSISLKDYSPSGNGTIDDTTAIQNALNDAENKILYIQKPTVKYKIGTLTIPSNIMIIIEPGTIFEAITGFTADQVLVSLPAISNVKIIGNGAIFQMLKSEYTTGEQRHCFSILGCTNIYIENISADDSGGDGYYLGTGGDNTNTNISLINCKGDNNKRNGCSIINGKNVLLKNCEFTNTIGTAPSYGLDIEPNENTEYLENIIIENLITRNNGSSVAGYGGGIVVALANLVGADRVVSIRISNHFSDSDLNPYNIEASNGILYGNIINDKPTWNNSGWGGLISRNHDYRTCNFIINKPIVINCNKSNNTSPKYGSAFGIFRESGDGGATSIGGISIIEPKIINDDALMQNNFYARDLDSSNSVINVDFIDPVSIPQNKYIAHYGTGIISDKYNQMIKSLPSGTSQATSVDSVYKIYNNSSESNTYLTITDMPENVETIFNCRANGVCRLYPGTGKNILPISAATGKYVVPDAQGGSITLERIGNTFWVRNIVGSWTVES